jgi:glutamate-ammonia-ligase adenylyltransferase
MPVSLDDLLAASPYLRDLYSHDGEWLAGALGDADRALQTVLIEIDGAGRVAADEQAVGKVLRDAKGRVALLAAAAETSGRWTTAQSTAALSDLADAALDAGLAVLLRLAAARGDVVAGTTPDRSGLALFALGKHGGRELNSSSDIDIVAFFDRDARAVTEPDEATKV